MAQDRVPTRNAYGETLLELGAEDERIVVFEADISTSTRTHQFAEAYPARFFQMGVAESNMMAAAAGMATTGYIPFVSTYAVFASMRACEQVRTFISYPNLKVRIAVSHGGITPSNDGVTHQATEDLGMMRTIPNLTVIMPADYSSTKALVRASVDWEGPVYLRFTRDPVPRIYSDGDSFEIGKGVLLKEGDDLSIITIGDMVHVSLEAAENLQSQGILPEVIDIHTLKPLDREIILESARKTNRVVTVEDHQINNGLGSAVAEVLCEQHPTPLRRIGLRNTFAESGEYYQLLTKYGMDAASIEKAAYELVAEG